MAAIRYTKAEWIAQADIQELDGGKYRGVVVISREGSDGDGAAEDAEHTVEAASDSPEVSLEDAKSLAHWLLANVTPDEYYR